MSHTFIFLGATHFGREILQSLLAHGHRPCAIFGIPEYFNISYSSTQVRNFNFYDFSPIAKELHIPFKWVCSPEQKIISYYDFIKNLKADFMLVAGWYYTIPSKIYRLTKLGAFGFHNSLLPQYAGGAPLVWALIEGQKHSGVSLFRMEESIDSGDIIAQKQFSIEEDEYIADILKKATKAAIEMALELFDKPICFTPQSGPPQIYPQRSPVDGKIDLNWDSSRIYNFIRAQSAPYHGAYIETIDGKWLVIEKARISDKQGGGGRIKICVAFFQGGSMNYDYALLFVLRGCYAA